MNQGYNIIGLPKISKRWEAYLAAFKLRKLVFDKRIDLLHSHNVEPLFECGLCKLITPRVKWIHTYHFGNYPHLPLRYLMLEGFYSRVADKLVAVGHNQKNQIVATYRLKPQRVVTVYNGIDIPEMIKTAPLGEKASHRKVTVIGSICTFIHQKGLDYLLQIAKAMKNIEVKVAFWVAGDGPLRSQLEKEKLEMGLDETVKFLGWIPDATQTILPQIDIFLQTSRWEAMSMVILEAMAAGKPIVATDVGENRRVVGTAGAGFIVQPGDVCSTVLHLEQLVAQPELCLKMGESGRTAVRNYYNVAAMTRQYEALYAQVLGPYE